MNKHLFNPCAGLRFLGVFLLSVTSAMVCHAQQKVTPSAAPKPPLIAPIPDPSAWTVQISNIGDRYRAKKAEKILNDNPDADLELLESEIEEAHPDPLITGGDIRSIRGTYAKGVRREMLVRRNGKNIERYLAARYFLFDHPRENRAVAVPAIDADWMEYPMEANQFGEFEWISSNNHIGRIKYEGRPCDVYEWDSWRALIDADTKLPVLLESGSSVRRYQFDPDPKDISVALPQHFAELIHKKLLPSRNYLKKHSVRER